MDINSAAEALKKAAHSASEPVKDAVDHVTSYLVLLVGAES